MIFENAYPLIALVLVALFYLFYARRQQRGAPFPSPLNLRKKPGQATLFLARLPRKVWWTCLLLLAVALANPLGEIHLIREEEEGYRTVLVVDISFSMSARDKIDHAKQGAVRFIEARPNDIFALVPFDSRAVFEQGQFFTRDRDIVSEAVNALRLTGTTRMDQGVLGALYYLFQDVHRVEELRQAAPSFAYLQETLAELDDAYLERFVHEIRADFTDLQGRYLLEGSLIVIIADAEDLVNTTNASHEQMEKILAVAAGLETPIYLISIQEEISEELMALFEETGGGFLYVDDPEAIDEAYTIVSDRRSAIIRYVEVPQRRSYRPELMLLSGVLLTSALALWSLAPKVLVE